MKKTLECLIKAYVGESQARNRYSFYAKVAKKEGFEQISEILLLTAEQERVHAKRLFEHIQELKENNQEIVIETSVPTIYGDTKENLQAAIEGENYEFQEMYPEFAKIAASEGYPIIAARLNSIAIAEKNHKERYQVLLNKVENNAVFSSREDTWWVCRECGYIHYGKNAPNKCPACDYPQSYYQTK